MLEALMEREEGKLTEEQLLNISNLGWKENIEFSIEFKSAIFLEKKPQPSKYVRSIPSLMLTSLENKIKSERTCSGLLCVKFLKEVFNNDYANKIVSRKS